VKELVKLAIVLDMINAKGWTVANMENVMIKQANANVIKDILVGKFANLVQMKEMIATILV